MNQEQTLMKIYIYKYRLLNPLVYSRFSTIHHGNLNQIYIKTGINNNYLIIVHERYVYL